METNAESVESSRRASTSTNDVPPVNGTMNTFNNMVQQINNFAVQLRSSAEAANRLTQNLCQVAGIQ